MNRELASRTNGIVLHCTSSGLIRDMELPPFLSVRQNTSNYLMTLHCGNVATLRACMADSNSLLKLKLCNRNHGLTASSDSQSRFHQYCASASSFPPLPPLTTLTAAQRLKRFKANCKKYQEPASNRVKGTSTGKKSLGFTFIVRKKGVRKSLAPTPGKSPFVRSARKKTIKRKSVLNQKKVSVLNTGKMTEVDASVVETYTTLNNGFEAALTSENICELKQEAVKMVFLDERTREQSGEACKAIPRQDGGPFVEYFDENGSNASEEIDVVNNKHEVNEISATYKLSSNGCVNGASNQLQSHHSGNASDNASASNVGEDGLNDQKADPLENENVSEETVGAIHNELEPDTVQNGFEEDDLNIKRCSSMANTIEEDAEMVVDESRELIAKEQGQNQDQNLRGDTHFDALVQIATENETLDDEKDSLICNMTETQSPFSLGTGKIADLEPVLVTAEVHAPSELKVDDSHKTSAYEKDSELHDSMEPFDKVTLEKCDSEVSEEKSSKKKLPRQSLKKQATSKTQASPKKKPQKRKSSPSPVKKPKTKKGRSPVFQEFSCTENPSKVGAEAQFSGSSEKEPASCAPVQGASEPLPFPTMVRRSQFKRMEPVGSCSMDSDEKTEKTQVDPLVDVDPKEPATLKSSGSRRPQRSFSPSRRAPLRTSRRGGAGATVTVPVPIVDSTPPSKRKAQTWSDQGAKRVKNEMFETPRWHLLSSPLKNYWSPHLTNKIHYNQPDTPTSEPPPESMNEDTPPSSPSSETTNMPSGKSWCTIA